MNFYGTTKSFANNYFCLTKIDSTGELCLEKKPVHSIVNSPAGLFRIIGCIVFN